MLRPLTGLFPQADFPNLLLGLELADDAAVYRLTDDLALVQTLDFFPPVVDDPYVFGAVAAANAMSDVFAMGGEVVLALNIAAFPESLPLEMVTEILRGGAEKVAEAGGVVAGGHTIYDDEPKYGMCVTGTVRPDRILTKGGARPGHALYLTKPLGTGIVLSAARADAADPAELAAAQESMLALNLRPSRLVREAGAGAVTDVTGFGLVGHAHEVARLSGVRVVLEAGALPLLPGALRHAAAGVRTGGAGRNREHFGPDVTYAGPLDPALEDVLFDPQTSGGLLVSLPPERADGLERRFAAEGLALWRIGEVTVGSGIEVRP